MAGVARYFDNNAHTVFDDLVNHDGIERSMDSSIIDTYRDAWIPCENTRKILGSIATSTSGSSRFADRENLTMPGLAVQGDINDGIRDVVTHFLGEEENIHRDCLTADDVTQDERGLRNLIQAGCYRAAIMLTEKLLAVYGQGYGKMNHPSKHTPHSLQLWYTRLAMQAKLRQIEVLKAESQPFGNLDKPDMYFIFYPELYGTRQGSIASFAFRLLIAEAPSYWGKTKEAIDNLYAMLATINRIIKSDDNVDSLRLWNGRKSRVLISIVNCALIIRNFVLAVDVLEDLYKSTDWSQEQSDMIKSSVGRVYLYLGDVLVAEKYLTKPEDRGLMAVAQNAFQEASNYFKIVSAADPSNITLVNNMAVCLLYTGDLNTAVQLLENAVTRNPIRSLQESVILNMSTLYELHTTHCKQSKLHLLCQLNRYKGDAIDVSCLKLT